MRRACRPQPARVLLVAAVAPMERRVAPPPPEAAHIAHITYLTSVSAYLDAGRLDGLRDSAQVTVVRHGTAIGILQVQYLASHSSSCAILALTATPLAVGDSAGVRAGTRRARHDPPRRGERRARSAPERQPTGPAGTLGRRVSDRKSARRRHGVLHAARI